jgi:hypothetical protein
MAYRFAQFSDIHFGQEQKDGTRVTHDLVREGAVKDCRDRARTLGPATAVIVTGDTAFAGRPMSTSLPRSGWRS